MMVMVTINGQVMVVVGIVFVESCACWKCW